LKGRRWETSFKRAERRVGFAGSVLRGVVTATVLIVLCDELFGHPLSGGVGLISNTKAALHLGNFHQQP